MAWVLAATLCLNLALRSTALADTESIDHPENIILFRIGTGGSGGTYFPIGSLIAEAITDSSGRQTDTQYPTKKILALAQRSNGSVANVREISEGLLEAGLAQADVIHWAYTATGPFDGEQRLSSLRTVATLYLEHVHLVVRNGSNIDTIDDLAGKRVSLDEVGSGTLIDMKAILEASGLTTEMMKTVYLKPADAVERFRENRLDAFFVVGGYPIPALLELVEDEKARVISIGGDSIGDLVNDTPFFTLNSIPTDTYMNNSPIETIGVAAQLILTSDLDDDLVYNITGMLWSDLSMDILKAGHPKGNDVKLESALLGIEIPLHKGAERFYKEKGLIE